MNETTNHQAINQTLLKTAGVLLVITAILAGLYMYKNNSKIQTEDIKTEEFAVTKTELVDTQIPSGFPVDLPIEARSKVVQNYEAKTTDGRLQSTRVMTTLKSTNEALKVYTDFFANLGWVEALGRKDTDVTVLMLKGDNSLLISVNENATQEKSISLTLTELQ